MIEEMANCTRPEDRVNQRSTIRTAADAIRIWDRWEKFRKLEHNPEKCGAVFRKDHAQTIKLERDDDSKKSHLALESRTDPLDGGLAHRGGALRRYGLRRQRHRQHAQQ